ncbi:hypothetical protein [Pectinatus haikarae]|uniref:Uncharacterized protein n=1 Tax=Pectinatus haikarae TaxID=349096 RepID=A0ABT9Y3N1_9FIRM|nr:hypothetical protein [Pectinatus haikarae]MDQ0202430.1 hypothetical protein [Pectinatus haikarae]
MMISKNVSLEKTSNNWIAAISLAVSAIILLFLSESSASAEIRLPELETPAIHIPSVPAVPSPQMPEIKSIGIDTDKIANEIDEHAKAADKDNKKAQGNSELKNNEKNTAPDKIRDNKYIKRDAASKKDDRYADDSSDKNKETDASSSGTDPVENEQENKQEEGVTAQQLLTADFSAVMFYIFSRTAFIAIVLWLAFLQVAKKLPVLLETFSFALMNIFAGAFYFPMAGRLDGEKLDFYNKVINNNDFLLIMGAFAVCSVVIAGMAGALIIFLQNVNRGGNSNGKNTKKFI